MMNIKTNEQILQEALKKVKPKENPLENWSDVNKVRAGHCPTCLKILLGNDRDTCYKCLRKFNLGGVNGEWVIESDL